MMNDITINTTTKIVTVKSGKTLDEILKNRDSIHIIVTPSVGASYYTIFGSQEVYDNIICLLMILSDRWEWSDFSVLSKWLTDTKVNEKWVMA